MISEIIAKWNKNKNKLEEWFKQNRPDKYKTIVEKIFKLVINDDLDNSCDTFNVSKMTIIDDSDYSSGTQIFIIPNKMHDPRICDYLITSVNYGSCSGSDTIMSIQRHTPEQQVKDYMTLALHLVQKLRWLSNEEDQ